MQVKHHKMKYALITLHALGESLGSFLYEYCLAFEEGDIEALDKLIEAVEPTLQEIDRQIKELQDGGTIK